jgi:hypothetical protein
VGEGGHDKRVSEGVYGGMCFVSIYKNRRLKPTEIVLRRGEEGNDGRRVDGGSKWNKIYCKHICKYHNEFPCTTTKG